MAGIHRDEIEFEINGKSAKNYGSQGQIRTAVLCLKSVEILVNGDDFFQKGANSFA